MRAIKALGQNFLISTTTVDNIVSYTCNHSSSPLVEIGPGKGALTLPLAPKVPSLLCVEKDALLAFDLIEKLKGLELSQVTVLNQDALDVNPKTLIDGPYDLIGSLPFNISKRIIHQFLCSSHPYPHHMFVVVQAEVGKKYVSSAPNGTALGAVARVYGTVSIGYSIPRTHFSPIPEVDAVFLHFIKEPPPPYHAELSDFIHLLFRNPRKQIRNTLKQAYRSHPESHPQHDIEESLLSKRAEQLTDKEMRTLFFMYNMVKRDETEKD
jgi:16S rRNA (adenine1518-N6/adenine1519-N6)-dimethyltransferase